MYHAICKSVLGRYAVYTANLLSMVVLARLFTPELFGTVASIMVFFLFFQLMAEAGLGPAIINIEELADLDRNGLFGLTVISGAALGLVFYFLAPVFLKFYELPRVDEVVPYVAIALLFFAATIAPSAFLQRDQAFFRIANAGLTAEIVSTSATILLSYWIDPLHALAAKATFSALTNFLVLYFFSATTELGRPSLGTKFSAIKPLLAFSVYQFGFNFINYFSRNLDNILVGKYLGASSLGVYDKAYQLMRYPMMLLTFAMTPAIQPVIRKYAGDKEKVESTHSEFTFKLSLLGAAAALGIFVLAPWMVLLMLGTQWQGVVPIIQVLTIAIPVQVVMSTSGSFYQAMNRADLLFYAGALAAVTMISAIVWGVYQKDMISLSWALVAAFHINFLQTYYIMYSRVYQKSMARFLLNMTPAVIVVVGMTAWLVYIK